MCILGAFRRPPRVYRGVLGAVAAAIGVIGVVVGMYALIVPGIAWRAGESASVWVPAACACLICVIAAVWQAFHHFRRDPLPEDWHWPRAGIALSLGVAALTFPFAGLALLDPGDAVHAALVTVGTAVVAIVVWAVLDHEHHAHSGQPARAALPIPVGAAAAVIVLVVLGMAAAALQQPSTISITRPQRPSEPTTGGTPTTTTSPATSKPTRDERNGGGQQVFPSTSMTTTPCRSAPGETPGVPEEVRRLMRIASEAGSAIDWGCLRTGSLHEWCVTQTFDTGRALLVGTSWASGVVGDGYRALLSTRLGRHLCARDRAPLNRIDLPDGRRDLVVTVNPVGQIMEVAGRTEKQSDPVFVADEVLGAFAREARSGRVLAPAGDSTIDAGGNSSQVFRDALTNEISLVTEPYERPLTIGELYRAAFGLQAHDPIPEEYRVGE